MRYISQSNNIKKRNKLYWGILSVTTLIAVAILVVFPKTKTQDNPVSVYAYESATEIINEESEWIPELPVRLVIPTIGVDAEVQYVGLAPNDTGEMDVPSNFTDVGWYKEGVRPGMRGSAVITGHFNGKEVPEGVFYNLHKLDVGDEIIVMSAERIEDIFYVVKVETYYYDDSTAEIFVSNDGKAKLNLITCSGEWLPELKLYNKRTVVFTELLSDVE